MNYYNLVVAVARHLNNPRLGWKRLKVFCEGLSHVDFDLLKQAWKEFKSIPVSKQFSNCSR